MTQQTPDFDLEYSEATEGGTAPVENTPEVLPEKYKGKSIEDLIQMHQNAEKKLSTMGNELGQVRKLADTILELKKENVKEPEPVKPVTVDQLFQDPDSAIRQTVATSDVAKRADEAVSRVEDLERSLAMRTFESGHPDWKNDLADPTFRDWVAANRARVELFQRADQYDATSANALWDMWGEYKELKSVHDKREEAKVRRKENLNAVKTVSEGSASTIPANGPVYSRAKLMELQIRAQSGDLLARNKLDDPAFQSEMLKAYQEKRIR